MNNPVTANTGATITAAFNKKRTILSPLVISHRTSQSSAMPAGVEKHSRIQVKKTEKMSPNVQLGLHKYGYIVGKTLGTGAYAKVKSAHAIHRNKQVAIKIVNKKYAPKDVMRKFLPREIECFRAVSDIDGVIGLQEVIHTEANVYFVMDIAENGDLLTYINQRKCLHEGIAQRFFTDAVKALQKCHDACIVHRDLKCENLLLDSSYRIKITDFGFARRICEEKMATYCGSYAYAAPEVINGTPYEGKKTDIWSLGVILYAMVVGRLPFKDSDMKVLLQDMSSTLVLPSHLSDSCKSLIQWILTFSPDGRPELEEIMHHTWCSQKFKDVPNPGDKPVKKATAPKAQSAQAPAPPPKATAPKTQPAQASALAPKATAKLADSQV